MIIMKTISLLVLLLLSVNSAYAVQVQIYVDSIEVPASVTSNCANSAAEVDYSVGNTNYRWNASIGCYDVSNGNVNGNIIGNGWPMMDPIEIDCSSYLSVNMIWRTSGSSWSLQSPFRKRADDLIGDGRRGDILTATPSSSTTLSPTISAQQSSATSIVSTNSRAAPLAVTLYWGVAISSGTCDTEKKAESSNNCLAAYIVIGVESAVLAILLLVGVYLYVKNNGGCNCPSLPINRRRVAPPTPVIRQDIMLQNDNPYGNRGGSGDGVHTTSFAQPQSHMVTSPIQSNPMSPQKPQTMNNQQRTGFMDRFKKEKTVPLPPQKDYDPTDTIYDEIPEESSSRGHQQRYHRQDVPPYDANESYDDVIVDGRNEIYDEADDPSRHHRHR